MRSTIDWWVGKASKEGWEDKEFYNMRMKAKKQGKLLSVKKGKFVLEDK